MLDASVAVRWFVRGPGESQARPLLAEVVYHPERFAVPELFAYELTAVLHRHHADAGRVVRDDVAAILRSGILRYPMTEAIMARAERFVAMGLTGYDSVYPALAEELDGIWVTLDSKAHARIANEGCSRDLTSELERRTGTR